MVKNKYNRISILKLPAFTLAEVLITLGIIGIVAAMTIPGLITNIRYLNIRSHLKKSFTEWNQAAMLFLDNNDSAVPEYAAANGASAMIAELSKCVKGFAKYADGKTHPYNIENLSGIKNYGWVCDSDYYTNLAGSIFAFDDSPKDGYNGPRICIDVNGIDPPNVAGIDVYSFIFTTDGHVIPDGADHKDNNYTAAYHSGGTYKAHKNSCQATHNADGTLTCAYFALKNISPTGRGEYWKDYIGKKQYK